MQSGQASPYSIFISNHRVQAQNLVRASEEFKLEHILSHIQYFRASDYIELVALVKTLPALVQNSQRKVS